MPPAMPELGPALLRAGRSRSVDSDLTLCRSSWILILVAILSRKKAESGCHRDTAKLRRGEKESEEPETSRRWERKR
jgi:hypothetical protein